MKAQKLMPVLMATAMLGLWLSGCGSDQGSNPVGNDQVAVDDYDNIDLNLPYGGLTATDEQVAFDDPYLMQAVAEDQASEVDDPLASDPEVQRYEGMGGQPADPGDPRRPRFTFVRLTWGMLDGPVDAQGSYDSSTDLVDWTGSLDVDRGIVIVRRFIRFERPEDHLVFPRQDRQTVAWVSHTGLDFDGLLIEIIEPPLLDAQATPEPNVLHFVSGPFRQDFPVADLPQLDEVYPVLPEGNALHVTGFGLTDISLCPKGFLSGIWRGRDGDPGNDLAENGIILGRWMGLFGGMHGFVRGRYGFDDAGNRVFVAKYISLQGRFRALINGTWEPAPDAPGRGTFRGTWINSAGTEEGVMGGHYVHSPTRPEGGFFTGRWATFCDDEAAGEIQ